MKYCWNDPSAKARRRKLRCEQTDAEACLWRRLRNKQLEGYKFFRQYGVGPFILDFYCPRSRLAIELDGSQHMDNIEHDNRRTTYLQSHRIEVIRFWNNQVLQETDAIVESIWQILLQRQGA